MVTTTTMTDTNRNTTTTSTGRNINQQKVTLNPQDVLLGRGDWTVRYEGNVRFRDLIREKRDVFGTASGRSARDLVASDIIRIISDRGGRFLRKEAETALLVTMAPRMEAQLLDESKQRGTDSGTGPDGGDNDITPIDGTWVIVDRKTAMKKVKQAFRDKDSWTQKADASIGTTVGSSPHRQPHHQPPSTSNFASLRMPQQQSSSDMGKSTVSLLSAPGNAASGVLFNHPNQTRLMTNSTTASHLQQQQPASSSLLQSDAAMAENLHRMEFERTLMAAVHQQQQQQQQQQIQQRDFEARRLTDLNRLRQLSALGLMNTNNQQQQQHQQQQQLLSSLQQNQSMDGMGGRTIGNRNMSDNTGGGNGLNNNSNNTNQAALIQQRLLLMQQQQLQEQQQRMEIAMLLRARQQQQQEGAAATLGSGTSGQQLSPNLQLEALVLRQHQQQQQIRAAQQMQNQKLQLQQLRQLSGLSNETATGGGLTTSAATATASYNQKSTNDTFRSDLRGMLLSEQQRQMLMASAGNNNLLRSLSHTATAAATPTMTALDTSTGANTGQLSAHITSGKEKVEEKRNMNGDDCNEGQAEQDDEGDTDDDDEDDDEDGDEDDEEGLHHRRKKRK